MSRPTTDRRFFQALDPAIDGVRATTHDRRRARWMSMTRIGAVLVVSVALLTTAAVSAALAEIPSPLAGPGVGELKKSQRKKIDRGWKALKAGDIAASRKKTSSIKTIPAARLLELQVLRSENQEIVNELMSLCNEQPKYAAAWITLSIAAEEAGIESVAINAAARGAELWPASRWSDRADSLSTRWIDDRVAAAAELIDLGRFEEAGAALDAALELDPERRDATLLTAKIHLLDGDASKADAILAELSTDPEAVYLRGTIAEDRGDWHAAMDLFTDLPAGYPGRNAAINRAQTEWRLTLLPNYARTAMTTVEMTRGELAVILVALLPRLKTFPGGDVPVMSDIVDYPGQREIITVVRLGLMQADRRGHLFRPNAPADADAVRKVIDRARTLLGLPSSRWCTEPDMVGSGCHSIPSPPSGEPVVRAVLDTTSGAD